MSQQDNKTKQRPKKQEPWNAFAYLASLARKKSRSPFTLTQIQ